jgi:hypothetical protein
MTMRCHSLAVLFVAALFVAGCGTPTTSHPVPNKDDQPKPKDDGKPKDGTGAPLGKPDFTVTAGELADEYKKDSKAMAAKYKGKVIEVSGLLDGYTWAALGLKEPVLTVVDPKDTKRSVQCFTDDLKPWSKALPGQEVKVKGTYYDFGQAALKQTEILSVTGDKPPTVTAAELAKEFATDALAAQKKYKGKYVVLTGEVDKVAPGKITLKTEAGMPPIQGLFAREFEMTLKPGQKVKALAYLSYGGKDVVTLEKGIVVE